MRVALGSCYRCPEPSRTLPRGRKPALARYRLYEQPEKTRIRLKLWNRQSHSP